MAQPIELPSRPPVANASTPVNLGDLADKILRHINHEYSPQEINQIATDYSRIPFEIKYDEASPILTLPTTGLGAPPGVILFNRTVKRAMDEHGANVTKNQIILILCELIPGFFLDNNTFNGEDQVRDRLYACPLCRVAWEEYEVDGANGGGGKKRRRSGLKSHRRIRTRHKSNKKTKHKKRKQKKTKRKKMRRRK